MQANQQRIEEHIESLSRFTATPGEGVTRLTYRKKIYKHEIILKKK